MKQQELQALFDYDTSGRLAWKHTRGSRAVKGTFAGSVCGTRRQVKVDGVMYYCARLIWVWHFGEIPAGLEVDHKDRNRLNDTITNLRLLTPSQNCYNKADRVGASGVRGVSMCGTKYRVQISKAGKNSHIGIFNSLEEALKARELALGDNYA